jgi:hypothetical protein
MAGFADARQNPLARAHELLNRVEPLLAATTSHPDRMRAIDLLEETRLLIEPLKGQEARHGEWTNQQIAGRYHFYLALSSLNGDSLEHALKAITVGIGLDPLPRYQTLRSDIEAHLERHPLAPPPPPQTPVGPLMTGSIEHVRRDTGKLFGGTCPALKLEVTFSEAACILIKQNGIDQFNVFTPRLFSGLSSSAQGPITVKHLLSGKPLYLLYDTLVEARTDEKDLIEALNNLKAMIARAAEPFQTKKNF